jgi:hypothetical protein
MNLENAALRSIPKRGCKLRDLCVLSMSPNLFISLISLRIIRLFFWSLSATHWLNDFYIFYLHLQVSRISPKSSTKCTFVLLLLSM